MAYRNKTYVCFDGDSDIRYYNLMRAWKQSDNTTFDFYDAHDINNAKDSSNEETIKRKLRERLSNTKVVIVLIGEKTQYLYKFVRWEMEQALSLHLPIIGVNLNGLRQQDLNRCPAIIRNELVVYVSFNAEIIQYALENWPKSHDNYMQQAKIGPYYYNNNVYER